MASQKRATRAKQRQSGQTAFVKQYEVLSGFSFPPDFDLSKNSIVLAEAISKPPNATLLLYWSSAERAKAIEPKLSKMLGLKNGQEIGDVVEVVVPQEPKWLETPAKWGQWLITAGAIVGALSVIQDHFTDLFGRPHAVLFASDKAQTNIHAGDPVDFPLVVTNEGRSGHISAHLDKFELKPFDPQAPPIPISSPISDLPQILAGQNQEIHLRFSSPPVRNSKLQHYAFQAQATIQEGSLWPAAKVRSAPFEVVLWPDRMREFEAKWLNPDVMRVEINMGAGLALDKLRGQLTFSSPAAPESDGIVLTGSAIQVDAPIVISGASGSSVKIQFQTGPVQACRGVSAAITVRFERPLTESQWNNLKSSIEVAVQ